MEMNAVSETSTDLNRLAPLPAQDFIDFCCREAEDGVLVERPASPSWVF
jgi:hypothetical protein